MKYRVGVASLIMLNLVLLVLFQNCGAREDSQLMDSSYVDGALSTPEVYVTQSAACNGQYNGGEFFWGSTIAICITKAGNNPKYCLSKDGGAQDCFNLSGAQGWSRSGINDTWSKVYNYNPDPSKYFSYGVYAITVYDTVDNTSQGSATFKVK